MESVHPELFSMYEQHVCSSFDKQLYFHELVRGRDWVFELERGQLSFGESLSWSTQVLATESTAERKWLWAWADHDSGIPQPLLEAVATLGEYGRERQIPELGQPCLPLNGTLTGEMMAMIATGVCAANACFLAPFEGGVVYLLVKDDAFPPNVVKPVKRIVEVFPQVIEKHKFHHRSGFIHYAAYYGLRLRSRGNRLLADAMQQRVDAEFDDTGTLVAINRFRLPGST